jgi:outer membrane protein assembly factor BamA
MRPAGTTHHIGDSLGGVGVLSASALLSVPLPFRGVADKLSGVRAFTFVNVGCLANPSYWGRYYCHKLASSSSSSLSSSSSRGGGEGGGLWGAPRASVGGGLSVAFTPNVRMELTYSVPVLKSDHDCTRGFQIGLGMSMN